MERTLGNHDRLSLSFVAVLVTTLALSVTACQGRLGGRPTDVLVGSAGLLDLSDGTRCFALVDGPGSGFTGPMCEASPDAVPTVFHGLSFDGEVRSYGAAAVPETGARVEPLCASICMRVGAFIITRMIFPVTELNRGEDEEVRRRNAEWERCRGSGETCSDPDMEAARQRELEREREMPPAETMPPADTTPPADDTTPPADDSTPPDDTTPPDEPPADEPPADEPPADEPPADEPPADEPPADEPPADEPPADEPPADEPPADEPPPDEPPPDEPPPDEYYE